jgi:Icc-related predicted phosphoesterase
MRFVIVSDLHGDLAAVDRALGRYRPDAIFSCGDWGDPDETSIAALEALVARVPIHSTFGNHDPVAVLAGLKNPDGTSVLLGQGEVRDVFGLRIAAIGGIWAKSHTKPYYVTDADVANYAAAIARGGSVDVLLTHGCPIGLADLTPTGRHGGQRCFLDAFKTVKPRLHVCGHLHRAQTHELKDGTRVMNVGATPEGTVVVVSFEAKVRTLVASLDEIAPT